MNVPLILLIAVPFIGGLLVIFPGRYLRVLRWIFSLLTLVATGVLAAVIMSGQSGGFRVWRIFGEEIAFQFFSSPSMLVLGSAFLFLWLVVILYSFSYFKKEGEAETEFYALSLFMLGSTLGLLFTQDLIFTYLFWEIAAVATWRLVGFERSKETISAATYTVIINFVGSAFMLVGFLMLMINFGSLNLAQMAGNTMPTTAGIFILVGIFAKSAVIPLYIWVPRAYAASPAPVVALLAGAIESFGLVVFLKLFSQTLVLTQAWQLSILVIAFASSLVAGGAALVSSDYRRILGYSTVSQLAFVLAGFAVLSKIGIIGGILFIIAHGLGKAALLLGYGTAHHTLGTRNIGEFPRLIKRFPVLFVGIVIATISIIGLPPLLGFFAKLDVIYGILTLSQGGLLVGAGFILASLFTLLYMLRLLSGAFFRGEEPGTEAPGEPIYLSVMVLVLSLSLLAGSLLIKPLANYIWGGG